MSEIVYGRNPVLEWLRSSLPVEKLYLLTGITGPVPQQILKAAEEYKIPISHVDRNTLQRLCGSDHHQGVVAQIRLPAYVEVDEILQRADDKGEPPLVAILDCVQDPHNLGAILRNADGSGVHGVVIPRDNAASLTAAAIKASAGAAAHVPIARVTNLARTMDELKQAGLWLVGAEGKANQRFDQFDFKGAIGIVLGAEGKGLRRLVREKCDFLVTIPMKGWVDSLNVSAAAALLFYEARRQRGW